MAPKHLEPAKGALAGTVTAQPARLFQCLLLQLNPLASCSVWPAGMKADAQRQKAAALLGEEYKPAVPGVGAAWCAGNLDFLCSSLGSFSECNNVLDHIHKPCLVLKCQAPL